MATKYINSITYGGDEYKVIDDTSGYTKNTGTVTSVGISNGSNGGLAVFGSPVTSSGTITVGHSNTLLSAQTTQAVYPIAIDINGHITSYGTAVTPIESLKVTLTYSSSAYSVDKTYSEIATASAANKFVYIYYREQDDQMDMTYIMPLVSIDRDVGYAYFECLGDGCYHICTVDDQGGVNFDTYNFPQGTVTSVRVQATSPVVSSVNTAQTETLNTTISLADAYGDTKNPYGTKNANTVLAGPSSGSAAAPSFRSLVSTDIPALGNIQNTGALQTSDITIATGDKLVVTDSSDSSKVARASISFDTTNTTDYLRKDGTWQTVSSGGSYTATSPISISSSDVISHDTSGVTAGTYVPYTNAKDTSTVYFPSITVDSTGHITSATNSGYSMSAPTVSAAAAAQTASTTGFNVVGGVLGSSYGALYYRQPYQVTPILNYGAGNDSVRPYGTHTNPLGYSFFTLTAGQTSTTINVYDSYSWLYMGRFNGFIVTDVVARDAVTKERVIVGWEATPGALIDTGDWDDGFSLISTVTVSIAEAYTNNIEFEVLYHRVPANNSM